MSSSRLLPEFPQYLAHENGSITTLDGTTPVRTWLDRDGYKIAALRNEDGSLTAKRVHVLIYIAFNGPIPEGLELDHRNENKGDASLSNLIAVTHSENCRRSWSRREASEKQRTSYRPPFLTPEDRKFIKRYRNILTRLELSLIFKCSMARISQIQREEKGVVAI